MPAKLKKGDKVFILAGKDKGKEGEIVQIVGQDKAIVQGINLVTVSYTHLTLPTKRIV